MLACVGFLAAHAATGKVCLVAVWVVCRPLISLFRAGQLMDTACACLSPCYGIHERYSPVYRARQQNSRV